MMVAMFTSWSSSLKNIPGFGAGVRRCILYWLWLVEETRKALNVLAVQNSDLSTHWNHSLLHVFRFPTCWPVFFLALHCQGMSGVRCRTALAGEQRWWSGDLLLSAQESFVTPGGPWGHDILKVASRQKQTETPKDVRKWLRFIEMAIRHEEINNNYILEFLHHTCPIMVMPQGLLICGRLGLMTYIHFSVYWLFQVETCVWGGWQNCKHDSREALAD